LLSIGFFARHKDKGEAGSADRRFSARSSARLVLPQLLRRPARFVGRLMSGNMQVSPRGWTAVGVAVIMLAVGGGLANSRQGHSVVANLSSVMGFTINQIAVEGIDQLDQREIVSRLELDENKSLFSFDINTARRQLSKLAWVKDAIVAKSYPDQLIVTITERQPFAIWQKDNALNLIERGGEAIVGLEKSQIDKNFSSLPLLVGEGANNAGAQILYLSSKVEALENRIKAYARIAERRWDLHLENGMVVRLPDDAATGLSELARLDKLHNLLALDVEVIDLRLPERLVVTLGEAARRQHAGLAPDLDKKDLGDISPINMVPVTRPTLGLAKAGGKI